MDFECLIILGERKKVLLCNKAELLQKIAEQFDIKDAFEIQTYNPDYEEWTEAHVDNLETKCKIKIVVIPNSDLASNNTADPEPIVISDLTINEVDEHAVGFQKEKVLPRPYRLPQFAADLENSMQLATVVTPSMRRRIVQSVFEDMFYYTMYPSTREYNDVCALLIYKYPKLSDRSISSQCNVGLYESWHRALVTKFKSERQKIKVNPIIEEMRKKHGTIRRASNSDVPIVQKRERLSTPFSQEGENLDTVECHLRDIRTEIHNDVINGDLIDDRMERTKAHRQEIYRKRPIAEVLEIFPCLRWHSQLVKDCERFFGKCITEEFARFFSAERTSKILTILRDSKYAPKIKRVDPESNLDLLGLQNNEAALVLLPLIFKEDPSELIKNEPGLLPTIVPAAELPSEWFKTTYYVCVEHTKVCEVDSFAEGLQAVLCIIFLFNLEYPKNLKKSLSFIGNDICKLEPPLKQFKSQIALVLNKIL